jgi:beta-glucosidase
MGTRLILFTINFLFGFFVVSQSKPSISSPEIEAEVKSILSAMSLEEKVGQTCQITLDVLLEIDAEGKIVEPIRVDKKKIYEALVEYKVGSILNVGWHTLSIEEWDHVMENVHAPFKQEKVKTPIIYGIDAIHGVNYTINGTLFPQEIGLAATWNPDLAKEFGNVTAYETRASGIPWNFSPVLDLGRQPLWSRTFETLGEDPYLASEMGKAIILGYQGTSGPDSVHVAACLKHFVGYSNPLSGRDRTPAWIPEKYMRELYMPPFKEAIEQGALTVMVNSGVVNGVPGHANYHFLTEVLKEEWGFDGFAVSDWEDFLMLNTVHRTAESKKAGIVQAINAGMDMSMVPNAPQYIEYCDLMKDAINEGSISMQRLDDAVSRILRVKLILGLYEKRMNQSGEYPDFASKEHKELALQSALESITLLKNNGVLPLKKDQKVLISGPTSNNLTFLNGAWTHTWQGDNPDFNTSGRPTVREEFERILGKENVLFSQGVELFVEDQYETARLLDTADFKIKAQLSEVIVLCLGEYPATEKPGDIRSLNISPEQIKLAEMAYATGKPVVIILIEGRPRIIRDIVDESSAIVQAYLPGDFGADALGQLLFGEVNFSGKLPYSYPKYDGQIEFYDHPRSVDRHKNGFNAYQPEWDFGYGISYASYEYTNLTLSRKNMTKEDSIVVTVDVHNTGDVDGKEVVQLYISDHFASLIPAGKSLKGFSKIELKAGETKKVRFVVYEEDLVFYKENEGWISEKGDFSVMVDNLEQTFQLK